VSLEVKLQRRPGLEALATPHDKEVYDSLGRSGTRRASGIRVRGGLAPIARAARSTWADWWGDNLAKIDIRTKQDHLLPVPAAWLCRRVRRQAVA